MRKEVTLFVVVYFYVLFVFAGSFLAVFIPVVLQKEKGVIGYITDEY